MNFETVKKAITDENVRDIMEIAGYGGITHWAIQPTHEEFEDADDPNQFVIVEGTEADPWTGGKRQVEEIFYLSYDDIRWAFAKLLNPSQDIVNRTIHSYVLDAWGERDDEFGIDTGYIDADAADAIVQTACFGGLVYG